MTDPRRNHSSEVPPKQSRRISSATLLFWVLLCTGFILRIYWLGRASYFIDEVNMVRDSANVPGFWHIIQQELSRFTWYHRLPLLGIILHAVSQFLAAGQNYPAEWITRLPFAIFGTLTLPLVYGIGMQLKNRATGLWAMAFMTFSVFHIYYSREAYDYSMFLFFVCGSVWGLLRILRSAERPSWKNGFIYLIFATGALYSHLTSLIWLSSLSLMLAIQLLRETHPRSWLSSLWSWAVLLALPYVLFTPFLWQLLVHGYTNTDDIQVIRALNWTAPGALIGRMGLGETIPRLFVFLIALICGSVSLLREKKQAKLLYAASALFLVLQLYMQRYGRFEIRYYAALFPLFMLAAGAGCALIVDWVTKLRGARSGMIAAGVLAALLLILNGPSIAAVVQLKYRGYYKYVADWLVQNLPENGIYTYNNVYELRGIPMTYPTPGRFPAYPIAWDGWQMYHTQQVEARLISFFERFPLACFINERPPEYIDPAERKISPLPRNRLFMNQLILDDPAFQNLVKWKTHPSGNVQPGMEYSDHILIMYNRPEDLPDLAIRNNRPFYFYFGPEWEYTKDSQMRDWRTVSDRGAIHIGRVDNQTGPLQLTIVAAMPPSGGSVQLTDSTGKVIGTARQLSGQQIRQTTWNYHNYHLTKLKHTICNVHHPIREPCWSIPSLQLISKNSISLVFECISNIIGVH